MSTSIETPIVERAEAAFEDFVAEAERILAPTRWEIGRIASECKEVTGKTDAELGDRIGLSGSQVAQRRYVWDMFAAAFDTYQNVSWSHFYAALKWDDAVEVLAVANSEGFSVAEMVRYRNIRSGKTAEPEPAPTLDASHVPETKEKPLAQPTIQKVTAATRKTKPETSGGEATIASQVPPDEEQPPQTSDGPVVAPSTDDPLAGLIATLDRLVDAVADDCEKRKKIAAELRRFADRMDPPEDENSDIVIPKSVDTPEVRQAVAFWCSYINGDETHKSILPNSPQMQALWQQIASWQVGADAIVARINEAVAGTWSNLRKPEPDKQASGKKTESAHSPAWGKICTLLRRYDPMYDLDKIKAECSAAELHAVKACGGFGKIRDRTKFTETALRRVYLEVLG